MAIWMANDVRSHWPLHKGLLTRVAAGAARSASAARFGIRETRSLAGAWLRPTLDLIFPRACVHCDQELSDETTGGDDLPFCRACFKQLQFPSEATCRRCGGPLPQLTGEREGCYRCDGRKLWFDETVAAGIYEGLWRELVLRMKRVEGDPISLAMGELLWHRCGERFAALDADVVVPIPLHWRRRLAHRTNSASVMGEVLAGRLGIPMAERLLRRCRNTKKQSELTPPQRWENVRKAFQSRAGYHLQEAHVLVVDDILTTGATCSEAARALRSAGAARVTVVVAARAIG